MANILGEVLEIYKYDIGECVLNTSCYHCETLLDQFGKLNLILKLT